MGSALLNRIELLLNRLWENKISRGFSMMLAFGITSMILGGVNLTIPGLPGLSMDFKGVGIFLSIVFLPHWIWLLGIVFIGSLLSPMDGSFSISVIIYFSSAIVIYSIHNKIIEKIENHFVQGLSWAVMIIGVYLIVLLPTMILCYILYDIIDPAMAVERYLQVSQAIQIEIIVTAIVTSLFVVSRLLRLELIIAKKKAEQSDKLKTAFLNNISHEIRTPLNTILVSSELIATGEIKETEKDFILNNLQKESRDLMEMMDQIIEFSKIESGSMEIKPSKIAISSLLKKIESIAREKYRITGTEHIDFRTDCDEDTLETVIETEVSILFRILLSLINNAIKYTTEGDISVYVKQLDEKLIRFTVQDTGMGISEEHQALIFDKFYQVDEFNKGVGLSLSFVKRMTELLKGTISIESEVGKGSRFHVDIPVRHNS